MFYSEFVFPALTVSISTDQKTENDPQRMKNFYGVIYNSVEQQKYYWPQIDFILLLYRIGWKNIGKKTNFF